MPGLERELGDRYPPAMPTARLQRAQKLIDGGQAARAKTELDEMIPLSRRPRTRPGPRPHRRCRLSDEAHRNRCFLSAQPPRRRPRSRRRTPLLPRRLLPPPRPRCRYARHRPGDRTQGPFFSSRLKALILAANNYLVVNDNRRVHPSVPGLRRAFPNSEEGPGCHWKYTWRAYLERKPNAGELLRQHVTQYPSSDKAGAALYYLGRLAESSSDLPAAKRFYNELLGRFPNYYYTALARENLKRSQVALAPASPDTERWLGTVNWPDRVRQADFTPDEVTTRRIERARLLARAGLEQWAEGEIRFGIRTGGKRFPLAVELAETAHRRGAPDVGASATSRAPSRTTSGSLPTALPRASGNSPSRSLTAPRSNDSPNSVR
ncbi:MAG: hypothetical protein QM757_02195 [Paludibaculum sp.]